VRANLDARNLLARGLNRLSQELPVNGNSLIAVNWQNWARSAPMDVELDNGQQVVELATGKPVILDVVQAKDNWRKARFVAENVPAMGYKCYALRDQNEAAGEHSEKVAGEVIESRFYRLTVDLATGGIKSLYDKIENREMVDANAAQKLNQ